MYDRNGDHIDPRDVLSDDEHADYRRSLRDKGPTRTVPALTEEAALAAYERLVYGT